MTDSPTTRRWLFADQLGPQYLDRPDQPVLLVESRTVFSRRRFHRAKAHLLLSALRHRASELGDQALYLRADTYDEALEQLDDELDCLQPRSYAADRFVRSRGITVLPDDRGFATTREQFAAWANGRKRLLLEDFYRWQRVRHDLLMEGTDPVGGSGTTTTTTGNLRRGRTDSASSSRGGRTRTTSTRRYARTSTAGSATGWRASSVRTDRAGPPQRAWRPWRHWRTS